MQIHLLLSLFSLIFACILLFLLKYLKLKTLKTYDSQINGKLEVKETVSGQKKLFLNLATQGLGPDSPGVNKSYWYYMAQLTLEFCKNKPNPKVLILGLGANTVSGLINRANPNIELTIVELDPVFVQICKEYFDLDKLTNSKVIVANALEVIKAPEYQNYFDLVINDIVTGEHVVSDPFCYQIDYVKQLISLTKNPSQILFNHPVHSKQTKELHEKFTKDIKQISEIKSLQKKLFKYPFGFNNYTVSLNIEKLIK
jgi:spermidine synthase